MLKRMICMASCVATLCCMSASSGCAPEDDVAVELEGLLSRLKARGRNPEGQKRIESALSMRRNDIVDPAPILLGGGLAKRAQTGQWNFSGLLYDEDQDILGWGVREEYRTADGKKDVLVEEYPIFAHLEQGDVLWNFVWPVHIRDSGQQTDAQAWQQFRAEGKGPVASGAQGRDEYARMLPPTYVSLPEPDSVDIFVYVYDKAGNRSEPVELLMPRK